MIHYDRFIHEIAEESVLLSRLTALANWKVFTHGMRNEFFLISEVAFDRPSLPSCFPDIEEILLLSQQENERIERVCEGDSLSIAARCASRGHTHVYTLGKGRA